MPSCQSDGRWHGQGIGSGQTWQDVISARSCNGASYANSTAKPIQILIRTSVQGAAGYPAGTLLSVNGIVVDGISTSHGDYVHAGVSAIVPSGNIYSCTTGGALVGWAELR